MMCGLQLFDKSTSVLGGLGGLHSFSICIAQIGFVFSCGVVQHPIVAAIGRINLTGSRSEQVCRQDQLGPADDVSEIAQAEHRNSMSFIVIPSSYGSRPLDAMNSGRFHVV